MPSAPAVAENGFLSKPQAVPEVLDLMEVRPRPRAVVDGDPAWLGRLLALFDEAVLHDEAKRPRGINKWTGPIDLSIRGDAADDVAVYVEDIAAELSKLINLPIELYVNQNWAGNIDIYITYWKNYWPFYIQSIEPGRQVFTCAVIPWVDKGRIKRATIKINAGVIDSATARACVLEELTQALGLFGETEQETETILHDGIGYEGLGEIDRLLLRTLYDPRMTHGLSNDRAASLASVILRELLAEAMGKEPSSLD
ncbi:MAG: DUF2927 domain-containing protein [Pseudomonadota bacterium]